MLLARLRSVFMITVPATFAAMIGARHGDAGRDWIDALPELVERYRARWSLEIDGAALHGYVALVVAVRRADGTPAVLKLSQVDDEKLDESRALRVWAGDGAVALLAESAGHEVLPRRWQRLGRPFPRELLDHALAECADLGPRAGTLLVNVDLHFENVLAARREPWLAIDPTVLEGDLEYGALALLWNRFDEIADRHGGVRERLATIVAALAPRLSAG